MLMQVMVFVALQSLSRTGKDAIMIKTWTYVLILCVICNAACSKRSGPPQLEGAWLGQGEFSASAGSKTMKAQLEILSDGSYRFLILEPRVLMMAGVEKGDWVREGNRLTLTPVKEKEKEDKSNKSVFETLRKTSPVELRVKQLTIADDLSALVLSDGPMELEFAPNEEATRKLIESGEVTTD